MIRVQFSSSHVIRQFVVLVVSIFAFLVPLALALVPGVFASVMPASLNGPAATDLPQTQRVVTNTNDSGPGSLRQVIADANAGDTIVFDPKVTGVITLTTGSLLITKSLTIIGPSASILAVSGNNIAPSVFLIVGSPVSISGLSIRDADYFGDNLDNGGNLALDNMKFGTGFLGIFNDGVLTVTNTLFVTDGSPAINHQPAPCLVNAGLRNRGTASIYDSTFRNQYGWGVQNDDGAVVLNNVTTSGSLVGANNGLTAGGSCGPTRVGVMTITNSTISDGVSSGTGSTMKVESSIVSTCSGEITSLGHNLTSSCNFTATGDISSTNLLLAPLGDYGGQTPTHNLLSGSPAIDAGDNSNCPATDQRGVVRPIDGNKDGVATCDIGAVEFNLTSTYRLPLIMR